MSKIGIEQMRKPVLLVLLAAVVVGACAVPTSAAPTDVLTAAPPTSAPQQLRITNSGQEDIAGLVALFPGGMGATSLIRVEYGNVAAGETTGYRDVPIGVYSYAAYEFMLDGQIVTEPAVDWIGESPVTGRKFTYRLALDSQKEPMMRMQLLEVLVDEP
jgi:hypothetical protein